MLSDASRQRDFPALDRRSYLNTAAEGVPPRCVAEALAQYAADKSLGMDGRALHEAQYGELRALAAEAFGLAADDVGVCSCSSEAFNLASIALRLQPGDEVVINDLDFPAGATPWLAPGCPATVKLWRSRQGALHGDDLAPLVGPRTRLVSMSLVSFYNGHRAPLAEAAAIVRRRSPAMIAVDVTQALGRIPLRLDDADLVVSSTHKWMLGSHGGGLVGVRRGAAERWTVPAGGWFNLRDPFAPERFDRATPKPGAASFSLGMPNYPAVYANRAALAYVLTTGVADIAAHADPLVRACLDGLKREPVELLTPDRPDALAGIVALRHSKSDEIYRRLHERNIHVMHHAGRLRVALHGYNTAEDVDAFLATLREALAYV